ncbi:MAG: winged helix-turn-helix domain-containing protein [Oscillochloridaceae bacterium umkhey_bin13]
MDELSSRLTHALLLALNAAISPPEFLLDAQPCTLGRGQGCVVLVTGPQISRLHARIEPSGPRYVLSDAGSVNGTYVNGRQLTGPHTLVHDDLIGLGSPTPLLRFLDPDATVPTVGMLRYDDRTLSFQLDGQPLELTKSQYRLLLHLYRNMGAVCTRESCAEALWGRDFDPGMDAGALDQAINSLRRALRQAVPDTDLIQTRRGLGYELVL